MMSGTRVDSSNKLHFSLFMRRDRQETHRIDLLDYLPYPFLTIMHTVISTQYHCRRIP